MWTEIWSPNGASKCDVRCDVSNLSTTNSTDMFTFGDSATPSAPYGITMLNCDGCSITLAWKSPKHCGGSKINAYYIDKRDVDSLVWKEVNQEAITERICTVSFSLAK